MSESEPSAKPRSAHPAPTEATPATYSPPSKTSKITFPLAQGQLGLLGLFVALALIAGAIGAYGYVHAVTLTGNTVTQKQSVVVEESSAVITVAKQVSPAVVS